MKRVAVLQSNYIPWKGYFDLIHSVDYFIWYDDVQYTKNDWRNRNIIKTSMGLQWLTIPCSDKGNPLINEVKPSSTNWQKKHWKTLTQAYSKAPYFNDYRELFEELYCGHNFEFLYQINRVFIERICQECLGINACFLDSAEYDPQGQKQDRLLDILKKISADTYLSGPAAKSYIDEKEFQRQNISLEWMDYRGYPEYQQLHGDFEHGVSILDLLFNVGKSAPGYIWGWRED